MKVNGIDAKKYNAKQLTVDIQPPAEPINFEWMDKAVSPTEFDTHVKMGHLKLAVYFMGKDRNSIIRMMSKFMKNFVESCDIELDGYQGIYRSYMTTNDYQKTIKKNRYILNIEFDGYFYDKEETVEFDGKTAGEIYVKGTRKTPCIIEVYAKSALNKYTIQGFGDEEIIIESLNTGKTIIIDGSKGIVTKDGQNAFDQVDIWELPVLQPGKTTFAFTNGNAKVTIRYKPMWI